MHAMENQLDRKRIRCFFSLASIPVTLNCFGPSPIGTPMTKWMLKPVQHDGYGELQSLSRSERRRTHRARPRGDAQGLCALLAFHVGCAVESVDGTVVTGATIWKCLLPAGVCAEISALTAAQASFGLGKVARIAVAGGNLTSGKLSAKWQ